MACSVPSTDWLPRNNPTRTTLGHRTRLRPPWRASARHARLSQQPCPPARTRQRVGGQTRRTPGLTTPPGRSSCGRPTACRFWTGGAEVRRDLADGHRPGRRSIQRPSRRLSVNRCRRRRGPLTGPVRATPQRLRKCAASCWNTSGKSGAPAQPPAAPKIGSSSALEIKLRPIMACSDGRVKQQLVQELLAAVAG
jgi:hypothetical protein